MHLGFRAEICEDALGLVRFLYTSEGKVRIELQERRSDVPLGFEWFHAFGYRQFHECRKYSM